MNSGKTLFAQLMDFLPWSTFTRIVARYRGDQRVRTLSCAEHYRAMAFAQLTYRESLRDIETCLSVQTSKLYSMGFRDPVRRSTLADANEARDWRIYAELAQRLIGQARRLYVNEALGFDLANTVYALELDDHRSLSGGLSVGPFPHDQGRSRCTHCWTCAVISQASSTFRMASCTMLTRSTCCSRRRVRSTSWIGAMSISLELHALHLAGAFFVTRAKSNMDAHRVYSAPTDRTAGIVYDQTIALDGHYTSQHYPEHLRRIRLRDTETSRTLVFLANQFGLPAATICALYKSRWQVELFFKWIKQHLRIKRFFGTSENAVKTQIWIAVSVYVLVAIVKKRLALDASLYTLLQFSRSPSSRKSR